MHHKKRVEETRMCISLYRLFTVEPRDLISSAPVLKFLFIGRDAASKVNSVKIDHALVVLADRTTACSTIGYHSNS